MPKKNRKKDRRPRRPAPDPDYADIRLEDLKPVENRVVVLAQLIDLAHQGEGLPRGAVAIATKSLTLAYLGAIARALDAIAFRD